MTTAMDGLESRARHWLVDVVLGGGLALGLITIAHAALPEAKPVATVKTAAPVAPPEPVALISFQDPVPGRQVDSPFGLRQLPWEEQGRLHAGVDISAPAGQPILLAADGVVTRVGQDPGYGRFVEVKHAEGLTTLYGHMGAFDPAATPGASLKAGRTVGLVGSTGTSTGSHLHFEIRDAKDRPLNPELFLGQRFATAGDLPLKAAARVPRGVRVAYVSMIPKAKRALMEAREDAAAADSAETSADASATAREGAPADTGFTITRGADGRPHGQLVL